MIVKKEASANECSHRNRKALKVWHSDYADAGDIGKGGVSVTNSGEIPIMAVRKGFVVD
jgi:hypothetical protein